ncbi:putative UDP-Gal or UDP-GlcNAc-dependent glycosyltransferase [Trypanosoma cruzi]|uniref:Putative UDP-Gal or UDP-GlcNAc-dependent glycosyltransferase n=1 Tax=Trypanosoma cruzi TaxID=5693 RepID=A0A2V2WPB4_TRYCR|nr:putative UDP-Gal or UDP-GlcNAc-dependent glycosyltransferase [Trypanosoma cruzi]
MAKTKLPTMKRKLRWVAVLLILFIAVTTVLSLSFVPAADDGAPAPNNLRHPRASAVDDAALAYIPRRVVDTWSRREYLVVLGIPPRTTRRGEHDATCSGRRAGGFPEWRRGRTTSPVRCLCCTSLGDTRRTATTTLPRCWRGVAVERRGCAANERGPCFTREKSGVGGDSGIEASIGMSRKTYMWFDLAHRLFPTARYIAKGDDDIFLRVPLLVAHLRLLPRRGIYMGYHIGNHFWVKNVFYMWRIWLAGATPCRGMWRRRWCRTNRCAAWHTCRTARSVTTSLHCWVFCTRTSWLVWFLRRK